MFNVISRSSPFTRTFCLSLFLTNEGLYVGDNAQ